MKNILKKVVTIAGSALMLGSTIGIAAAAAYPAPFVVGGTSDVAIVYGSGADITDFAGASALNIDLATDLAGATGTSSTTTGATATGGDSFIFEKSSTKLQLGQGLKTVVTVDITEDNMPTLLADGKYTDASNDEKDYTQKITPANLTLSMFDDNDYARDDPTVGLKIPNGANVLNYTLEFSDTLYWKDVATTTMPFMGKEYYVLSVTNGTIGTEAMTLLDAADTAILKEGESTTLEINGVKYDVSVNFISSTPKVKLDINGEITNSLAATETQKLADGAYVGIKSVDYTSKDGDLSQVEFSIGSGKLKLTTDASVQINDETISGLTANITGNTADELTKVVLTWNADDDLFVAPDSEVVMPGFESVKLSWGGMFYPTEETIAVMPESSYVVLDNFPLKTTDADIALVYYNTTEYTLSGKDSDNRLRTPDGGITASGSGSLLNSSLTNITFDGDTDDYFVASWNDTSSSESYLMRATNFRTESGTEKVDIQYMKDGAWTDLKTAAKNGTTASIGNVEIQLGYVSDSRNAVDIAPAAGSNVNFYTLFSKEGAKILLPWTNVTNITSSSAVLTTALCIANITANVDGQLGSYLTMSNSTTTVTCSNFNETYVLYFQEEDKDGNVGVGNALRLNWTEDNSNNVKLNSVDGESVTFEQDGDASKIWRSFIYGPLATEIVWDKTGDQFYATLTYHGGESYGQVFLNAPDATVTSTTSPTTGATELGDVTVTDSEVASVSSKNLIVVGGSCINTVAAELLGSSTPVCGAAFTELTGIAAGEALIKSFDRSGKTALLVAGYNKADTAMAITYLRNNAVDTTKGGAGLKVTSTTEASTITSTA